MGSTAISFPASPSIGQTYSYSAVTYKYIGGDRWVVDGAAFDTEVTYEALAANGDVGTKEGQVAAGDDSRFSDGRLPTDNSVTTAKLHAQYKSRVAIAALNVDFSLGQVFYKTLATNSTLTFSNLHVGVKDIEVSGNYTLVLPTWLKIASGEYDGTVSNLIQVVITNATGGSESGWCSISQEVT